MWMNENIKLEYIAEVKESTPSAEIFLRRFFNKAEAYEEKYGKDICNWNMTEIINFYCSLLSRTGSTIYNINSIFKKYTNYCISRNLTVNSMNHYDEISDEVIYKSCVNSAATEDRIYTREEILKNISELKNPSDKYLILAMFEGICGKDKLELVDVCPESINGNVITLCTGRELTISQELISIIKAASKEYFYYGYNVSGEPYERPFLQDDKGAYKRMIGCEDNDVNIGVRTAHGVNRRIKKVGFTVSSKSLINSGKIEMCKKICQERKISFAEALKDPDVVYRYGVTKSVKQFILKYEGIVGEL